MDEVPSPHIFARLRRALVAGVGCIARGPLFMAFSRHFESFLLPKPMHAFVVDAPPFTAKTSRDVAATPTAMLLDELLHGRHEKHFVVALLGRVTLGGTALLDYGAGPAFRHLMGALEMQPGTPPARRA